MPQAAVVARKPKTKMGEMPIWCHHHCTKMKLAGSRPDSVTIKGSAAEVQIVRPGPFATGSEYFVYWEVVFGPKEKINGSVYMTEQEAEAAFGLSDAHVSDWLLEQYGGDVAKQGAFIRYKNFLNIPCPGTGHDGDPNVSVELDDEIKEAVRKFLAS